MLELMIFCVGAMVFIHCMLIGRLLIDMTSELKGIRYEIKHHGDDYEI